MHDKFDARHWARTMLISSLKGDTRPEIISQHVERLRRTRGTEALSAVLESVLTEALLMGAGHRDGSLYCAEIQDCHRDGAA